MTQPSDLGDRHAIEAYRLQVAELQARLREAEETLEAIRTGEVDALIIGGAAGHQVYTLESADRPYRVLVEQMQEGAVTLAADGAVLYCNRRLVAMLRTSHEEMIGSPLSRFVPDEDRPAFDRLLAESAENGGKSEITLRATDGSLVPVYLSFIDLSGYGTRVLCGIVTDLTQQKLRTRELAETNARLTAEIGEREHTEALLRQAQKMEAVGQLTGGLAHDFNNLLTVVVGNLQLVQARIEDETLLRRIGHAMTAAERGAKLTQQLLAFSRRQTLRPEPVCVNDLLPEFATLVHRAVGEAIELRLSKGKRLWHCRTDLNQLESAILNLAINARDAMPEGGRLTIATANATLDETAAAALPDAVPGRYVAVSVSDTGHGMNSETLARVFEPFFTTKEVGKGTGLGLSMVYGFARQSDGFATVESEIGRGTTVRLYLPKAERPRATEPPKAARATSAGAITATRNTILLVEDDPEVRQLAIQLVEELGYAVLWAATGPEALAVLDREPRIDLLFTDIVMPDGMSGIDLAAEARRRNPGLGVLLTSGYTAQSFDDPASSARFPFVRKPYRQEELAAGIRAALEQRPASTSIRAKRPRILLVDDEALVAMVAEETLRGLGCEVVGPIARLDDALEAARRERLDGALLDVDLAGRKVYPAADLLAARGVPFAFVTGYDKAGLPDPHGARPSLSKPYGLEELTRVLKDLLPPETPSSPD